MRLITRCPECATAFRVHDEQLSARQGKVRCGACGLVFDAYASLLEVVRDKRTPSETTGGAGSPARGQSAGGGQTVPLSGTVPFAPQSQFSIEAVTIWPDDLQHGTTAPLPNVATFDIGVPARPRDAAPTPTPRVAQPVETPILPMPVAPAGTAWRPPGATESALATSSGAFDFDSLRAPPRVGAGWKIAAFVLVLALATQALFAYRSIVAATFPGLRPLFEQVCESLACDVPLPRHVELLKLESSDLRAENDRLLTLTAVIRNQARYEQGYPSLLLTLQDDRSRPVARRVIPPREYMGTDPGNVQTIPAGAVVTARVAVDALAARADGYEVLLIYP